MDEKKIKTPCGEISWFKLIAAITILGSWFAWLIRTGDSSAKIPQIETNIGTMRDEFNSRLVKVETKQEIFNSRQIEMSKDIKELLKKK